MKADRHFAAVWMAVALVAGPRLEACEAILFQRSHNPSAAGSEERFLLHASMPRGHVNDERKTGKSDEGCRSTEVATRQTSHGKLGCGPRGTVLAARQGRHWQPGRLASSSADASKRARCYIRTVS